MGAPSGLIGPWAGILRDRPGAIQRGDAAHFGKQEAISWAGLPPESGHPTGAAVRSANSQKATFDYADIA